MDTRQLRIFLSYASEDIAIAEEIDLALGNAGHDVFFDRTSLPGGGDYNGEILAQIRSSDLMVFLISPTSVQDRRYTRTELRFAQDHWRSPKGHVLPVMAVPTPMDVVPAYLRSVTILVPEGHLAAEVTASVNDLAEGWVPGETVAAQKRKLDATAMTVLRMQIEGELSMLDRGWMETRKKYMVRINDVEYELDSSAIDRNFIVFGAIFLIIGIVGILTFGSPAPLVILGLPLLIMFTLIRVKRQEYARLKLAFQRNRAAVASRLPR